MQEADGMKQGGMSKAGNYMIMSKRFFARLSYLAHWISNAGDI